MTGSVDMAVEGLPRQETDSRVARDLVTLTKPRITAMSVMMAATGMVAAPVDIRLGDALLVLVAVAAAAGGASALNMWYERDLDALMRRTRNRPLPAGRLQPRAALLLGLTLAVLATGGLWVQGRPLAALISLASILGYAFVYTPLKRVTPRALEIGALPGAAPPLIGWTAATGQLDPAGLVLFGVMFLWQIPHFLAISVYLKQDYQRAGIKCIPKDETLATTRIHAIVTTLLILPLSLALIWFNGATWLYGVGAALLGTAFLWTALKPPGGAPTRWAQGIFRASLAYLPLFTLLVLVDTALR